MVPRHTRCAFRRTGAPREKYILSRPNQLDDAPLLRGQRVLRGSGPRAAGGAMGLRSPAAGARVRRTSISSDRVEIGALGLLGALRQCVLLCGSGTSQLRSVSGRPCAFSGLPRNMAQCRAARARSAEFTSSVWPVRENSTENLPSETNRSRTGTNVVGQPLTAPLGRVRTNVGRMQRVIEFLFTHFDLDPLAPAGVDGEADLGAPASATARHPACSRPPWRFSTSCAPWAP